MCLARIHDASSLTPAAIRYKVVARIERDGSRRYKPISGYLTTDMFSYPSDGVGIGGGWGLKSYLETDTHPSNYVPGVHTWKTKQAALQCYMRMNTMYPIALVRVEARGPLATGYEPIGRHRYKVDVWREIRILEEIPV